MSISRVQYRERQRLTVADLRTEQDYRLSLAGRHHLSYHLWGVVRGLHVVERSGGVWTLTPGVAIDGYGREIFVPGPVDLPIDDPEGCSFVLLHFCEYPEQVPPERGCRDEPAPRTGQRFRVVVAGDFSPRAEASPDLGSARAAGTRAGLPPWPVLVAKVGTGCDKKPPEGPTVDYSATRYVGHRASVIRSPTGRAVLRLGLSSSSDVYHLLLSTADEGAVLTPRVGIDRDAMVHVWRPLFISGKDAVGQVVISENKVLRISGAMPAGLGARVVVQGQIDASRTLSARLADLGVSRAPTPDTRVRLRAAKAFSVKARFGGARLVSFDLLDEQAKPIALFDRVRGGQSSQPSTIPPGLKRFSVQLKPSGGALVMRRREPRASGVPTPECGDVERFRRDRGEPGSPVVRFTPGPETEDDQAARALRSVTTSKATDPVPRTEFRISGGAAEQGDTSGRIAIGAQVKGAWTPMLTMNGQRGLTLPVGSASVLDVKGTVYLPPIGKNDPMLPDLMAKAFTNGLRQMGRVATQVKLEVTGLPTTIVRGDALSYTLKITSQGPQPADVKRCLELIAGTAGPPALTLRTIQGLPAQLTPGVTMSVPVGSQALEHPATKVRLEVELLVDIAGHPLVATWQSPEITVQDEI